MKKIVTLFSIILLFTEICFGQVSNKGLVAYYPFNGNANDESGYKNNGIINGAELTTDRFGYPNNAFKFDGTTAFIDVPSSSTLALTGDKTVSVWVKIDSANLMQQYTTVLSKEITGITYPTFHIQLLGSIYGSDSHKIDFHSGSNYTNYSVKATKLYSEYIDKWLNITAVYSQSSGLMKIFLNDTLSSSVNVGYITSNFDNNVPLYIGRGYIGGSHTYFKGIIDDIRIYNYALTDLEVTELHKGIPSSSRLANSQNTANIHLTPTKEIAVDCGENLESLIGSKIKISNSLGQTVYQSNITQQISTIDIKHRFNNGIIFVQLIDANHKTIKVKKIVLD